MNVQPFNQAFQVPNIVPVFAQVEGLPVELQHVWDFEQAPQVLFQHHEFEVVVAVVVGDDRDAIVQLMDVGVGRVVDEDHLAHLAIDHSQIFDMHSFTLVAVLAKQAVMDEFLLWV